MTDQTAQEPTMEEILASIRRIISEDDAPAAPAAAAEEAAPAPAPVPQPEPVSKSEPEPVKETPAPAFMDPTPSVEEPAAVEDDVLDLTDRYEAPTEQSIGDLEVSPQDVTPPAPPPSYDSLVGESASASAASAFAGLAASFKAPEPASPPSRGSDLNFASGSTVEAMVAEMLKPMLKDWLDANLPAIVQGQVRKEVERIARSAG